MGNYYAYDRSTDLTRAREVARIAGVGSQPLLDADEWNAIAGDDVRAGRAWIQQHMRFAGAVVVLVGERTEQDPWVRREIFAAWHDCRPLLGVHVYGLGDADGQRGIKGKNPFLHLKFRAGGYMSDYVPVFEPQGDDPAAFAADLESKLPGWIERGAQRMRPRAPRRLAPSALRRRR